MKKQLTPINKKNIFLLIAVLFSPALSLAQAINDGPLQTVAPKLGGINITGMISPISSNSENFLINQVVVDLSTPVYKNFNTRNPEIFKIGIRYQGLFLSGESSIGADPLQSNLGLSNNLSRPNTVGGKAFHSIVIPLSFTYVLSPATNITAIAAVGFGSDLKKNLPPSDLIYTAGVRMGFQQDKDFRYGVTLVYNRTYSGTYLIPIPDIEWTINDRWNLSAVLPIRTSLRYKLNSWQTVGATFGLNAGEYRLDQQRGKYLQFQQMSGGIVYDLKISQNWKLNLMGAYTLMQKLQTFDNDQKIKLDDFGALNKRKTNYSNQSKSMVVQGGISYQF